MTTLPNHTTTTLLSHCKTALTGKKLSLTSRKLYLADIKRFLAWLPSNNLTPSSLSSPDLYQDYLKSLETQGLSPSMLKRTTASLRQLGHIVDDLYNLGNPTLSLSISSPKPRTNYQELATSKYLKHFTNYLRLSHLSPSTIKSYKSDVSRYLTWADQHLPSTKIEGVLKNKNIEKYLNYLAKSGEYPESTRTRKRASLTRFQSWYLEAYGTTSVPDKKYSHKLDDILPNPATPNDSRVPKTRFSRRPIFTALNLGLVLLLISAFAYFGYQAFSRDQVLLSQAYPSSPISPNRQLSFQGRLEDSGGTPITSSTNLVFKLFDASTVGSELYSTGTCAVTPDTDGVFSTQIGSTCGSGIGTDVFSENADVWLEVTVGAETLTPRQQIATVAYALNSETLQGIPLSSTMSAIANSIVPMNSYGEIIIGEQSPRMTGVSGTFAISAPALSLTTTTGSSGNISIAPDGTGQVNITGNTTSTNFFNVSNAQLTTGSLITGTVANSNTGYKLLDLLSGTSPTSVFSVDDAGLTTIGADLYANSGISTFGTAISDGTVEATQFCTGDGESNCVTDFSSLTSGASIWTDAGVITHLTSETDDLAIGGTTSTSPFFFDESAELLTLTNTTAGDSFRVNDVASDTTPFIIDADGNVGIGTTAPGSKLHVYGTSGELATFGADAHADQYIIVRDNSTYGSMFGYEDTLNGTLIQSGLSKNIAFNVNSGTYGSGTNAMFIESTGNVGIGTTAPQSLLDVQGGAGAAGILTLASQELTVVDGDKLGQINFNAPLESDGTDSILVGASIWAEADDTFSTTVNSTELVFGTNTTGTATEKMRIDSAGNVGIGTTNPSAKLDLYGAASDTIATRNFLAFTNVVDSFMQMGLDANGNLAIDNVYGADTNIMTIGRTGNVGIGDTSPDAPLDVVGDVYISDGLSLYETAVSDGYVEATGFCTGDGESNCVTDFSSLTSGASIWTDAGVITHLTSLTDDLAIGGSTSSSPFFFDESAELLTLTNTTAGDSFRVNDTASDTTPFIIDADGNVGIGTTAPGAKLEIKTAQNTTVAEFTSPFLRLNPSATTNTTGFTGVSYGVSTVDNYGWTVGARRTTTTAADHAFVFNSHFNSASGTERMRITNAGNVGIGTTTPELKLHVQDGGVKISRDIASDTILSYADQTGLGTITGLADADWLMTGGLNNSFVIGTQGNGASEGFEVGVLSGTTFSSQFLVESTTGNVGIGTTSPTQKLTISEGDIQIDHTTFANQDGIIYKGSSLFIHNFNYGDNGTVTTTGANTFVGASAGNLTMGSSATLASQGSFNTGVGQSSLSNLTTGYGNIGLGYSTLNQTTTGAANTAIGDYSLKNSTGNSNSTLGRYSLLNITSGSNNVALGAYSGRYESDGSTSLTSLNSSVLIGMNTKANASGDTNEIAIGYDVTGLGSNTVVLGNSSITTTALRGNVGIGTTSPGAKLEVYETGANATFNLSRDSGATIQGIASTTWASLGTTAGQTFSLRSNGTDRILLDTNGDISFNSGDVFFENSTNNVGIGTTSPGAKLEVYGSSGTFFDVQDDGSSVFSVSDTAVTSNLPTSFTSAGDVAIAYDLVFTNPTASYIQSSAPLYLQAGESYASSDLTLSTYNAGDIILDAGDASGDTGTIQFYDSYVKAATITTPIAFSDSATDINTYRSNFTDETLIGAINETYLAVTGGGGGLWTRSGTDTYLTNTGDNVGIGTTAPNGKLDVQGNSNATFGGRIILEDNGGYDPQVRFNRWTGTSTNYYDSRIEGNSGLEFKTSTSNGLIGTITPTTRMTITNSGDVGIGTTSPGAKLEISQSESSTSLWSRSEEVTIRNTNGTNNTWAGIGFRDSGNIAAGIAAQYYDTANDYASLNFATRGASGWKNNVLVLKDGDVGIGTTAPGEKLEVNGNVAANIFYDTAGSTYYLDPAATSTSLIVDGNIVSDGAYSITSNGTNGNITLDAGTGTVVVGSSGTGKLDVGTIDPPYSINGDKFATYLSGMTGVKEETTGTVNTSEYMDGYGYRTILNLASAPHGSDLWLFREITNLHAQFDQLVVLLSASSDTRTWYNLHPETGLIEIYSTKPSRISYRLTAPRFDADTWANTRDSESLGFVLDGQPNWDPTTTTPPPTLSDTFTEIFHSLTTSIAQVTSLETNLISPLDTSQPLTISTNTVITPTLDSSPTLTVEGEISTDTISAREARFTHITTNRLYADEIIAGKITANVIEGLDAKIVSLSAGSTTELSDDDLETITDRIKARLADLSGATAEDISTPPEATSSSQFLVLSSQDETPIASDSATLASLDADFVTINDYLAVIGSAAMTNLDITGLFYTDSIISKSNTLSLQPNGGLIRMANNTLIVDSTGQVMINGDLSVSGKILASSANLGSLELGTPPATPSSQLGQLLSVYNESGKAVATIDASGSASFRDLSTQLITIASPSNSTQSASTSALATTMGTTSTSNATAGNSSLITPNTEVHIESEYITPNTLVYLTPTTNTDNKVLFVAAKETCPPPPPDVSVVLTPCTRSFTVAIDSPASTDIDFNWWVIQLEAQP